MTDVPEDAGRWWCFSRRRVTAVSGRRQGWRARGAEYRLRRSFRSPRRRTPPRGYHWRSSKGRGALSFSGTRPIYSSPFLGKVLIASTSPVVGSPAVGADHFVNCKRPNALPLLHPKYLPALQTIGRSYPIACLHYRHSQRGIFLRVRQAHPLLRSLTNFQ